MCFFFLSVNPHSLRSTQRPSCSPSLTKTSSQWTKYPSSSLLGSGSSPNISFGFCESVSHVWNSRKRKQHIFKNGNIFNKFDLLEPQFPSFLPWKKSLLPALDLQLYVISTLQGSLSIWPPSWGEQGGDLQADSLWRIQLLRHNQTLCQKRDCLSSEVQLPCTGKQGLRGSQICTDKTNVIYQCIYCICVFKRKYIFICVCLGKGLYLTFTKYMFTRWNIHIKWPVMKSSEPF